MDANVCSLWIRQNEKKNTRLILDSFFKLKIKYKDGFSFHVTFKFMQMAEWTN